MNSHGKILLLGGTAESRELAEQLIAKGINVVYSIAGLVRQPDLECEIHSGGFSSAETDGAQGMADFCREQDISLVVDATHPYAKEISENAATASQMADIPCWRLDRPGWQSDDYPDWQDYDSLEDLVPCLRQFKTPFLSIGQSALKVAHLRPDHQTWIVRSARPFQDLEGVIQIIAIGPFSLEEERTLMETHGGDVLVAKNSGGTRVAAKMKAAVELGIPVFVQRRPDLPAADRTLSSVDEMIDAIETVSSGQ